MSVAAMTKGSRSLCSRRVLYRRTRRVLVDLLAERLPGHRPALERAARRFLRDRSRCYLARVVADRSLALAAAAVIAASTTANAVPPVKLSAVAAGTGGFVINGIDPNDNSGASVSAAGDVNGDGRPDLIVGAYAAGPPRKAGAGECYVVFGKDDTTAVDLSDVAAGSGGFVIIGIDSFDYSGFSVSGAGDVNGDGMADLIVGALYAAPGGNTYAGESYVVFGRAETTPVHLAEVSAGTGGFVIRGVDPGDYSGSGVSGAGDVNGDGLADLIVGASHADPGGNDGAGACYVIFGKVDTAPINLSDVVAATGGFVINGVDRGDNTGRSVSDAGDVNGDGLADLIVGAQRADSGGNSDAGESYVVFGKADTSPVSLADVAAGIGGFVINGIDEGDLSGGSVSGAGDVNGDGRADLIVGAARASPEGIHAAGESYVVFGKLDTSPVNLSDVATGAGGYVINGADVDDLSGVSVSCAGDVNGDERADLIVGAWRADPDGILSGGASYIVFGKLDTNPVELSVVAAGTGGFFISGIDPLDFSGFSVSGAGDVNGDGFADTIVGAFGADPHGNSNAGESYVVFGQTCPWDCADGDGQVAITDLLLLVADWGGPGFCDSDGGGVGIVDFMALLLRWGSCR